MDGATEDIGLPPFNSALVLRLGVDAVVATEELQEVVVAVVGSHVHWRHVVVASAGGQ